MTKQNAAVTGSVVILAGILMGRNSELQSLLMDVKTIGYAVVPKQKLLWYFEAKYDKPWVWAALLQEWEDLGFKKSELEGAVLGTSILLLCPSEEAARKVAVWAK